MFFDLPPAQHVFVQPKLGCEEQSKQYPSAPGRNDNCIQNCSVTRANGTIVYGYWDYFLGYSVCYRCSVPRGRGFADDILGILQ